MIKIKNFELRTTINEMTIGEFERISNIMSDPDLLQIEKYIEVLEVLGTPEEIINDLDDEDLFRIIKSFGEYEYNNILSSTVVAKDGYTYVAYEGPEFKLKALDMVKIEKAFKTNKNVFSTIIATIFKRSDLTSKEHYTDAHIKHKQSIVRDWNAGDFYSYIVYLTEKLNNNLKKKLTDESTKDTI